MGQGFMAFISVSHDYINHGHIQAVSPKLWSVQGMAKFLVSGEEIQLLVCGREIWGTLN